MARSFLLHASIVVFFLAGSSAPTPLYSLYQASWAFSPAMITVIFATYAIAVLASLLLVGSLSDYVGRRPVLIVAALVQAVAMVTFVSAHDVVALIGARVLQGLATGAAVGAAGAAMIDIHRDRGTLANGIVPMLGTGTGSMVSGIFVQFLPAPTKLVYVVFGVIFVAQAIAVMMIAETVTRRTGALASMRPRLHVPARLRSAVILAAPALVSAWALAGFYGSLGPTLVRKLLASNAPAIGGLALFVLASGGVAAVLASRKRSAHEAMAFGSGALVIGVGLTLVAVSHGSILGFFIGTAIAGFGFGASFNGAIRSVVTFAAPHDRAGVLSVLYLICYVAMGIPAVLAGIRVHGAGILAATREYGIAVMLLAASATLGTLLRRSGRDCQVVTVD